MSSFETHLRLPPGLPSRYVMREFFERVFSEYQWFKPVQYGVAFLNERLESSHVSLDALTAFYEERGTITITARTERDFILVSPAKPGVPSHTGHILWTTSAKESKKSSWRAAHFIQVAEVMRLLDSPLAHAGLKEDHERKTRRWVPSPDGIGQIRAFTVRDPGEGLAGLFWRNFYGPPFVRMFGERLASLPEDCRQQLGKELVLVQPYELPTQAGTPEGDARERELISLLGPECFYDFEHHAKPTRVPQLPLGPSH